MAILIQFICVLVKLDSIINKYPGGIDGFKKDVPNDALCMDSKLARVGFMSAYDVESYISLLTKKGLAFTEQGRCIDIVVVDQLTGPIAKCEWIEYGTMNARKDRQYLVCRLLNDDSNTLMTHGLYYGAKKTYYAGRPLRVTDKFKLFSIK